MALVRCYKHGRNNIDKLMKRHGYREYIPSENLPGILVCGINGCSEKGCILLKENECNNILYVNTNTLKLNLEEFISMSKPFTKEQF